MNTNELSIAFDLRWDNLRYNDSNYPSLNEYEKSLYFTQAQEMLFQQFYGKFDSDENIKRILSPLVKDLTDSNLSATTTNRDLTQGKFKSISVSIPEDLAFILTEQLVSNDGRYILIKPVKIDQYNILKSNPFRLPNSKRAWRTEFNFDYVVKAATTELDVPSKNNKDSSIEIITSYEISDLDKYHCRYLMYPTPIILEEIADEPDAIRGYQKVTEAILNNIVHEQLISIAVELANKALYGSAIKQQ